MSTYPRVIATHYCSWGSRNFKLTHGALTAFEDLGVVAVAEARANAEGLGAGGLAACGIAVCAAAGRTVAEQGRQGRQLAAEATEAAATPTGDSQQRDAEAACARDWSRHWQAGAFAAWGWGG